MSYVVLVLTNGLWYKLDEAWLRLKYLNRLMITLNLCRRWGRYVALRQTALSHWILIILCNIMQLKYLRGYVRPQHRLEPGPWYNIKMPSYQYRKCHCGDKTVVRSSYLHNGISYTGKMDLYIDSAPWAWFNIKMPSYQYRKSHCGDKTILQPSYFHSGISYTDKWQGSYLHTAE